LFQVPSPAGADSEQEDDSDEYELDGFIVPDDFVEVLEPSPIVVLASNPRPRRRRRLVQAPSPV
jgi:hypothetical protein